jgi:hypothetical protein
MRQILSSLLGVVAVVVVAGARECGGGPAGASARRPATGREHIRSRG